ncbi:MAG: hypothetical protein AABW93_02125 [Nanoarchaeota archaeon]
MPTLTISIDEKIKKILEKRAKKNLMSLREQTEDIIRRSASNYKLGIHTNVKSDDTLVEIFSRNKKGKNKG